MTAVILSQIFGILLAAAISFIAASYWFNRSTRAKKAEQTEANEAKLQERISKLERELSLVSQAVLPISTAFQAILIKELTHPHTGELDDLMERIGPPNTLSGEETRRLYQLLLERSTDPGFSEAEQDAATMLPLMMKRSVSEATPPILVQVVAIPAVK